MKTGHTALARTLSIFVIVASLLAPLSLQAAEVDTPMDVKFSGVIAAIGAAPGDALVIGGTTVGTDPLTHVVITAGVTPAVGMWAEVMARQTTTGEWLARQIIVRPERVILKGMIDSRPVETAGTWVIAGIDVLATDETRVSERGGLLEAGDWVEAVMTEDGGVLTATHLTGIEPQDEVEITGAIQAIASDSLSLSSIVVAIDEQTLVSGEPRLDLIARAAATIQEDGSLLARVVRVLWKEMGERGRGFDFTGVITALPADGLIGEWKIDGRSVWVMPGTRIHQERGQAVVGARVHVSGQIVAEKAIALEVTVLESPARTETFFRFRGMITALPAGGVLGIWVIADRQVIVTERTRLMGMRPKVGSFAMVSGVERATGELFALEITVMSQMPNDPSE